MKALGRFHGECYAIKESNSEQFDGIIKRFKESRYSQDTVHELWSLMMANGPKRAVKAVRDNEEYFKQIPDEFLQQLEQVLASPHFYGKAAVVPREPLATICHGDFLRNNVAFLYDNEDSEEPTKAMMFDFQTLRYSSPMVDLVVFICNSTGFEVRTKNFDLIFDSYFNEVIDTLSTKLGTPLTELPSYYKRDIFLEEYARLLPFGLGIASSFMPVIHVPYEGPIMEMFNVDPEAIGALIEKEMRRGGETVDRELRAIVKEIYDLHKKFNLKLDYLQIKK